MNTTFKYLVQILFMWTSYVRSQFYRNIMEMATYAHVVDISPLTQHGYEARQGCRMQSVDSQAQLGVGGKDGNNSHAQSVRQNFGSSYF